MPSRIGRSSQSPNDRVTKQVRPPARLGSGFIATWKCLQPLSSLCPIRSRLKRSLSSLQGARAARGIRDDGVNTFMMDAARWFWLWPRSPTRSLFQFPAADRPPTALDPPPSAANTPSASLWRFSFLCNFFLFFFFQFYIFFYNFFFCVVSALTRCTCGGSFMPAR